MATTIIDNTLNTSTPDLAPTSATIPQTQENPLVTELMRPSEENLAAQESQRQAWLMDRTKTLTNQLLDPSKVEYDFSRTSDPDTARKRALASAYVRLANQGEPIPGGKLGYQIARDKIAAQRFEGRGKGDDLAFFQEIQKEATGKKAREELANNVHETAIKSTIAQFFDPIEKGTKAQDWPTTLAEIRKSPHYQPGSDYTYKEIWEATRQELKQATEKDRGFYLGLFTALTDSKDDSAFDKAEALYVEKMQSITDPQARAAKREEIKAMIASMAKLFPEDQSETYNNMPGITKGSFLGNANRMARRNLTDIGRNIAGGKQIYVTVQTDDGEKVLGPSEIDPSRGYPLTYKVNGKEVSAIDLYNKSMGKNELEFEAQNFAQDIEDIRRGIVSPINKSWGSGIMGDIEMGIYSIPGAISTTVMAVVPYVGQALTYKMLTGAAETDLRRKLITQGVSDTEASRIASDHAPVIGALQYLPERLGMKAITRKIPALDKVYAGLSNKITNRLIRGIAIGAASGTIELSTEILQDQVIPQVYQDILAETNTAIPGTDWDQVKDEFWSNTVSTAVAILPLAALSASGGLNAEARAQAFATVNPLALKAYGITQEAIDRIEVAKAEGPESLSRAVEFAQNTRDPNSEQAMDAVQEIAESIQATREEAEKAAQSSQFPIIDYDTQSKLYTLTDKETGEEIGQATDSEGAIRLAAAHTQSMDLEKGDYVAYLASTLQGAAESAKLDADRTYPEINQRRTRFSFDLGTTLTATEAATQSAGNAKRVAAQLQADEKSAGGDGGITQVVFGISETDPNSINRRFRETTNKLYRGASVLTVFHEETHGFYKEALSTGRMTHEESIKFLKAVDSFFATQKTRSRSKTQFLPANFDELSEYDQKVKVDEAVSELMEAEILKSRKGGGVRDIQTGLISKNLSAIARIAGDDKTVGKFRAFINAVREFFGITLDRAHLLKKGLASGEISQADYDTFLNNLYGLNEESEFENLQSQAEQEIIQEATAETDAPFSLGPARLADLLRDDATARIRNPEARAKALSIISRKLADLRLEAEKLELSIGSKRLKKSLQREAAVRQAMRLEELENAALARHQGILSDDELSVLTSYPVHAAVTETYVDKAGRKRTRGLLMSRTQAAKRHPDMFTRDGAGEYDGADGMPSIIYGGQRMPDQLAQDLFDQGLIADPFPDTMWAALRAEQNTVGKMKTALESAKDDLRAARAQSITEAKDWLKTQIGEQELNYSPKEEILRASALLDAILSALPAELRGRIGGYTPLARLSTDEARLAFLRDRLARADRMLEQHLRKQFDKEFRALLNRARPEKDEAGKRPKGKLGSNVHDLFNDIRDAMLLSATETEAEVARLTVIATDPDLSPEETTHAQLQADLTGLVGNWSQADASRMEIALIEAQRIYAKGYLEHIVESRKKAERRTAARTALQDTTGSAGTRQERVNKLIADLKPLSKTKQFFQSLYSFEQILKLSFGNSKEAQTLAEWERRASQSKHDNIHNKQTLLENLFKFLAGSKYGGELLRWKMSQPGAITVKDGLGNEESFSEMQAITATMLWRQEDGRRHMEGYKNEDGKPTGSWHWTDDAMDSIESQLSDNAKAVRLHLTEQYAAEYDRLNSIYKSLYGVSLPKHKFYSPITVKPVQSQPGMTVDPVTGALTSGNMMSPGSLKTRSQSAVAEPDFRDAVQTYIGHTMQMEHWMAYAPFALEAQNILGNRELRNALEASAGKETVSILTSWIEHFSQGGNRDAAAHLALTKTIGGMVNRAASVALVGRLSVLVIQSTQLLAGAAEMPMGAFLTRFGKLLTGRLNWSAAIQSDFIRRRKEQMPPVVRQALDGLASAKPSKLKYLTQKMGETISGADALFTAGTYAISYDYHYQRAIKEGMTPDAAASTATELATRSTERVAQPTRSGTRSILEVTSTSPFMRLIWSFASEPRQKLALSAFAFHTKQPAGNRARALFVTWIAGGLVSSLIRNVMSDLRSDDDDEWFDERNWDPKRLALQTLTGPFQGIPIIGDGITGFLFKEFGIWQPEGNLLSMVGKGAHDIGNIPKWFSGDRDLEGILKDIDSISNAAGVLDPSGNAAAAASLSHLVRDLFNLIDNAIDGD